MTARRRLRVLVTRPLGEAELFAVALAMRGHEAVLAPLMAIEPVPGASVDLSGVQALVFTSANGVRAFAQLRRERDLPAFCVGNATADAARAAGFVRVESAAGDVEALAALLRARLKPADGALVHAAGTVVAGDLAGTLAADGFEVRRAQIYRAEAATTMPEEAAADLRAGRIDVATFFSPRTAETFAKLAQAAGLAEELRGVAAVALAGSAFAATRRAGCTFGAEIVAARPEEAALLDAIDRLAEETVMTIDAPPPKFELPPADAPASEKPKAAAPRAKPQAGILVPFAVALIVALVGILGWAYWQSSLTGGEVAGMRALEQRIAAAERRAAQAEARQVPAPAAAPVDLAPLAARIAALEARETPIPQSDPAPLADFAQRLSALESRPAIDPAQLAAIAALTAENRRLADELARVQAEIGRLQGGIVDQANDRAGARRAEFRLAVSQMREGLLAGRSFAAELGLVRELAGEAFAGVDAAPLEAVAKDGIETRASLAKRFSPLANAAVAGARAQSMPGLLGEIAERAQGLLSIRRVGDVPGDDPAARVARAEARLAVDDLAGALAALEGVQSLPWAAPLVPWIETARRRVAAERAAAALAASPATGG